MDPEDIALLLTTADRWFAANQPLDTRVAAFRAGHHEAPGAWGQFAEMGWLALTLPEAAGGFGAGCAAAFQLIREAGRDARPEPLALHLVLAPLLARVLPSRAEGLIDGSLRIALADRALGEQAVRSDDASTLSGLPGVLLGAEHATHWLVPVTQGGGTRLWLVDAGAKGITRRDARLVDSRFTTLPRLDAAPAQPLGGADLAERALDRAAAALVADSAGVLDAAFWLTLDYLKQRQQFGKPLSAQQAVQHKMAEVFCDLQQLLALAGRVAAELDSHPEGPWPTLAPAKAFLGHRALRAAGQLIQVCGGIAVTEEYKLTHLYRRLHVAAALFGSAEAQLARIDVRAQLLAA